MRKITRDIVYTDVYDDCTWFKPRSLDEFWTTNSSHDDVSGFELAVSH